MILDMERRIGIRRGASWGDNGCYRAFHRHFMGWGGFLFRPSMSKVRRFSVRMADDSYEFWVERMAPAGYRPLIWRKSGIAGSRRDGGAYGAFGGWWGDDFDGSFVGGVGQAGGGEPVTGAEAVFDDDDLAVAPHR